MLEKAQRHLRHSSWKMFHTMISFGFLLVMDNISIKMIFLGGCIQMRNCRIMRSAFPARHHSVRLGNVVSATATSMFLNSVSSFPQHTLEIWCPPGIKLIFRGHETRAVRNYQRAYLNLRAERRGDYWLCESNVSMNMCLMDCKWHRCSGAGTCFHMWRAIKVTTRNFHIVLTLETKAAVCLPQIITKYNAKNVIISRKTSLCFFLTS